MAGSLTFCSAKHCILPFLWNMNFADALYLIDYPDHLL